VKALLMVANVRQMITCLELPYYMWWKRRWLIPKIPCVFSPNFAVFDIVGKINSQKIKVWELEEVTIESWSYLVVDQPQKISAPHSLGSRRL
jgi:hypothetical protein